MEQDQIRELRELVEFLKANGIAEFEMERADLKVGIKFAGTPVAASAGALPHVTPSLAAAETSGAAGVTSSMTAAQAGQPSAQQSAEASLHEVKSPIVGTFYESPSPGAAPFVKIGDQVEAGQVLCIVEAMKLMNEVEADISGELVQRIAISGQPVEYGQPLFSIRPR